MIVQKKRYWPFCIRRYYIYTKEQLHEKAVHRQWEICWVCTCSDAPTVYRNNFGARWTELQKQGPCYSAAYRIDEVTAE